MMIRLSIHLDSCSAITPSRQRQDGLFAEYGCLELLIRWRTHQSLEMDSPEGRETHAIAHGRVAEVSEVSGLHHHYERVAA